MELYHLISTSQSWAGLEFRFAKIPEHSTGLFLMVDSIAYYTPRMLTANHTDYIGCTEMESGERPS